MAKIIVIINQKDSVGKTTTAIKLAESFAKLEHKTLLIDNDPEANTTSHFGFDPKSIKEGLYECLIENINPHKAIRKTEIPNLHLLPTNSGLMLAELEMINLPDREHKMKNCIGEFKNDYDFILIDCSPSLGLLNINGLTAADSVLIPVQCESFKEKEMNKLLNTIKIVTEKLNKNLEIEGMFFTMFDKQDDVSVQVAEGLKSQYKNLVLETTIDQGEADVLATQYTSLAKEILRKQKSISN